ncbi:hypothetical protein [Variovorax sp. efr-133-TYG-130]|uniref:hypothetical protein n=1 Tax=Variovorax sp. efr-133-TYG-130 TaxID=3040327 RepID=UPI0025568295|nr:hypothetical protein [Variovorax sp. efr-133-TYG-130]
MNTFQLARTSALLLVSVALGACTNSSITQVKESALSQSNFTFGEVLDGAKGCKSTDWDHSKADYGQTLVEFTCLTETSDEVVQAAKQRSLQELDRVALEKEQRYAKMLEAAEQNLANAKNLLERSEQARKSKLESAAQALQVYEAQAEQVANSPINNPTWKRMAEQELAKMKSNYAELQSRLESDRVVEQAQDQGSIANAQKRLEEMTQWKERYLAAAKATKEKVTGDLNAHFSGSHKFQLKVTFLAQENKGVNVNSSEWFLDDKKVASNAFIPAFLRHPQDMDTALKEMFKEKIQFNSMEKYSKEFPIECSYEWDGRVSACALKS